VADHEADEHEQRRHEHGDLGGRTDGNLERQVDSVREREEHG